MKVQVSGLTNTKIKKQIKQHTFFDAVEEKEQPELSQNWP